MEQIAKKKEQMQKTTQRMEEIAKEKEQMQN